MLDFSNMIDLPLVWALIIGAAIFLYVFLDGFDLGVGILFPFAPSESCRNKMINSIAPFWDGNETWLVLGGGGLFAAFPLAYSILLPAFYMPIITMLLGLIMRGIAFEFRFKADKNHVWFWNYVFHFGSLIAAFCQGCILGGFVGGVEVSGRDFSGGAFDWATAFSMMTGFAMIFGYALLGSTWLIMKTTDVTQNWARNVGSYVLFFVGVFMVFVSGAVPLINNNIAELWFSTPNIYYLSIVPITTLVLFILTWSELHKAGHEYRPFFYSIAIFFLGYLGLGLSIFPWMIPYKYTIWEAAAHNHSLSLMLCAFVPLLPVILGYTAYSYYVFRGKSPDQGLYS